MDFERQVYFKESFRYVGCQFSGKTIAESGIDAYEKAIKDIKNNPNVLSGSIFPKAESPYFRFYFLGVKTDGGYSVELWEKWKEEGEI